MFVDTQVRPEGEQIDAVSPAKLKLSEAIRICGYGEPGSLEQCVLGRAYTRLTGRSLLRDVYDFEPPFQYHWHEIAASAFSVSTQITRRTEELCYHGTPPSEIADWLEAQGL